jgi:hypothetical protein
MGRVKKTTLQSRERVRRFRERKLQEGLSQYSVYCHHEDWPVIKRFAEALTNKRRG